MHRPAGDPQVVPHVLREDSLILVINLWGVHPRREEALRANTRRAPRNLRLNLNPKPGSREPHSPTPRRQVAITGFGRLLPAGRIPGPAGSRPKPSESGRNEAERGPNDAGNPSPVRRRLPLTGLKWPAWDLFVSRKTLQAFAHRRSNTPMQAGDLAKPIDETKR